MQLIDAQASIRSNTNGHSYEWPFALLCQARDEDLLPVLSACRDWLAPMG
jgi:hypothetical protein